VSSVSPKKRAEDPRIGALLRVPTQAIHRRIIAGLNRAGFDDLRLPHVAVLQNPGPDGYRPSELAERAGMSKQAMNQLLHSLEQLGYLTRRDTPADGRARIVHFTARGWAMQAKLYELLADIEAEWRAVLGDAHFDQLQALLCEVWESELV